MKILGITGGIGAGKSSVTALFAALGAEYADADAIARDVVRPSGAAYPAVVEAFGKEILCENGEIDRKKLAGMVFGDPERLALLNRLTHPCVFAELRRRVDECHAPLICLDVPLLFSCAFPIPCDATLAVVAPRELRIARVMERDGCDRAAVEARMASQLTDEELSARADYTIQNDGDRAALQCRVEEIYRAMVGG